MSEGNDTNWTPQKTVTSQCLHATWCDSLGNMLAGGGNLLSAGQRYGVIASKGSFASGPISDF